MLLVGFISGVVSLNAQPKPAPPPEREPHHHLVFRGERLRVLDVRVAGGDSTQVHQHDADYVWIGLGTASLVNSVVGKPPANAASADLAVHFAKGGFAHAAKNSGKTPFHNVTIELLGPAQGAPKNLCERVVDAEPLNCPQAQAAARKRWAGANATPAFETDRLRVTLLEFSGGATVDFDVGGTAMSLVPVSDRVTSPLKTCGTDAQKGIETLAIASAVTFEAGRKAHCTVKVGGSTPQRYLALEFLK